MLILDLSNLHWEQLDKLTGADLERICLQVLNDMNKMKLILPPRKTRSKNEEESFNSTMTSATVLENCKVRFRHALVPMSLIECDDEDLTFYLAEADDNHVFVLRSETDGSYSFMGTQQNVTYARPNAESG